MSKETIEKLVKEFGLKEDSIYPNEGITIHDLIRFMTNNTETKTPIYDSIIQKYFEKIDTTKNNVHISFLENLYQYDKFNIEKINKYTMNFNDLRSMSYASARSKGNELVYEKKDAISGVLASLHSFVFKEKYEEKTITGMKVPLDGVSLYKFENYTILQAGSAGNHRLFGCILFSPLLGNASIVLKNLYIHTPKNTYLEQLLQFSKIVKFFEINQLHTKIIVQNDGEIEIEVFNDEKDEPYNYIFKIYKMSIDKVYSICNNELVMSLKHAIKIKKKDKNFKLSCNYYPHNEEVTFDTSKHDDNISFKNIQAVLYKYSTPILKRITNQINIFAK